MKASISRWRLIPLVGALLFAGVASVAFALGVSSGGSSSAFAAQATTIPGHPELGPGWTAPGGLHGTVGQVAITITKIDGSTLSLATTDGWTRTIDATGATITKGGQTIALTDLKVGDQINFREARQSDGSYKITTIVVVCLRPPERSPRSAPGPSPSPIRRLHKDAHADRIHHLRRGRRLGHREFGGGRLADLRPGHGRLGR